jgi:hypothetical protein
VVAGRTAPGGGSRSGGQGRARVAGLATVDGVAEIDGNYPSKGSGERAAWFRDSEGYMLGVGQPTH